MATGHRVGSAFVGVTGAHISFENRRDELSSAGERGVITADDLSMQPASVAASVDGPGRKLLHAITMSYSLDGAVGIRNPLGMHSRSVDVDTHLVTGGAHFIDKLVEAVESAGITVESLVLEPLASGLAVLTPEEKERGAVIVDMGGGTSDIVGFSHGQISYTGVIPVGGYQFTNDISLTFNTTYEAAETAKLKYASTELAPSNGGEEIPLPVIGQGAEVRVQRQDICQLTRERAHELARLVRIKLDEAQMPDSVFGPRLVLTGGTSNLPGLATLMRRTLNMPVRHGVPEVKGTLPKELKDPAYATSVGILLWALTEYLPAVSTISNGGNGHIEAGPKGFMSLVFGRLLARFMPLALFAARKWRI
jgi:cell division protein FtsA